MHFGNCYHSSVLDANTDGSVCVCVCVCGVGVKWAWGGGSQGGGTRIDILYQYSAVGFLLHMKVQQHLMTKLHLFHKRVFLHQS